LRSYPEDVEVKKKSIELETKREIRTRDGEIGGILNDVHSTLDWLHWLSTKALRTNVNTQRQMCTIGTK
jgi:hypothetical protein